MAALLFFCGCNKTKQFTVTLNLDNADQQSVYLCKATDGNPVCIDTAIFAGNQAVLTAPADDPQTLYSVGFKGLADFGYFTFFTENQNTTISGDYNDLQHWTVKGCPNMNILNDFRQQSFKEYEEPVVALQDQIMEAYRAGDTVAVNEKYDQFSILMEDYNSNQMDFVRAHSDSYIGHYMLNEIKSDIEFDKVKELYGGFTAESMYSKRVKEYIEKQEKVEVGAPFIDFTLKTAEGEEINLEKVINSNRLVLVDFWASWCGPCRGENPYVKAAYEKYHADGLEIIGVSVDNDEAAWLKAVADDGMNWIQVRDVDNSVATNYLIQFIPSNFLYDSNGVMIAKGLRGEALEAKLAEVLQ